MSEFIELLSGQGKKELEQLLKTMENGVTLVKEFNKHKIDPVPSKASNNAKKYTRQTQKLTEAQKEARRINRALRRQKEKLNHAQGIQAKGLQRLRYETQQVNKIEKQRAIISSRLSTEYQKQQASINLLSRRYQELATKQQLGTRLSKQEEKELKDVTYQIQRKQAALKRVDANMGVYNRNVGNYKSAWKGVGSLIWASVGAFGAFSALEIGREIFGQVKEINSLNKALEQVTESQEDFNRALDFLTNLADEAGSQLNPLQSAYTKFRASANSTNLTLEETERIFRSVVKTGGLLGLSTDDLTGALRALEQMLSKGKVQAEEIRGQLGERLPGAFQILAKSMGLTTAELSKQLEMGQVYAEEVLPKFADELAKVYSLDTIDKVDTLTASQNRLSNAWNNFIRQLEEGEGVLSSVFGFFIEQLTKVVQGMTWLSEATGNFYKTMKVSLNPLENLRNLSFSIELSFTRMKQKMQDAADAGFILKRMLEGTEDPAKAVRESLDQVNEGLEINSRNVQIATDLLNDYKEGNIELSKSQQAFILNTLKENDALEAKKEAFEKYLRGLEEVEAVTKKGKEQGQRFAKAIKQGIEDENIEQVLGDLITGGAGIELEVGATIAKDELEEYNKVMQRSIELMKELAKAQKSAFQKDLILNELGGLLAMINMDINVLNNSFETLADKTASAFDKQIALADGVSEIFSGISQTIFQNEQIRLQNQIGLTRDYYNQQIELAQGNETQQQALREEADQKERQLRAKQAKTQRESALFQIAIDTATAIIKTFANLGFPAGVPAAAGLATIGLAKAALVQSQPLPQFKHGRKGGEATLGIVGDGGKSEVITDKKGRVKGITPKKPTLTYLDKGDSVFPSIDDYKKQIYSETIMANVVASRPSNQSEDISRQVIKSLRKARFINQNQTNINVDLNYKLFKAKYA